MYTELETTAGHVPKTNQVPICLDMNPIGVLANPTKLGPKTHSYFQLWVDTLKCFLGGRQAGFHGERGRQGFVGGGRQGFMGDRQGFMGGGGFIGYFFVWGGGKV